MSVRLLPAGIERQTVSRSDAVAAPPVVAGSAPPPRAPERRQEGDASWFTGFAARQSRLNQHTTAAQRALAFLEALQPRLRDLGRRLGADPGGAGVPPALGESLEQVRALWAQRHAISGGTLDGELGFFPGGDARQAFRLRGLDRAALALAEGETLTFYPRGMGRPARTLYLAAEGDLPSRVARLEQSLAPAGIRVRLDADGEPTLSILESAWDGLREQLLVQGGGRRFPSGWPTRVAAEPVPGRIAPAQWQVEDTDGRRETFRQTSATLTVVEQARTDLTRMLAESASTVYAEHRRPGRATLGAAAHAFAAALAEDSGYRRLSTAGACLRGLNRQRVGSVLDH